MISQVMKYEWLQCFFNSCIYQPSRGHPLCSVFLEVVSSFDCIPSLLSSIWNETVIYDHQNNNTNVEWWSQTPLTPVYSLIMSHIEHKLFSRFDVSQYFIRFPLNTETCTGNTTRSKVILTYSNLDCLVIRWNIVSSVLSSWLK